MKPHEVTDYLRAAGMRETAGGSKYAYWTFHGHKIGYAIRLGARNMALVHREHRDMSRGSPKIEDAKAAYEVYYGKVTPAILDRWIELAKQPPSMIAGMKAAIFAGLKAGKPIDRELIRDFAIRLLSDPRNDWFAHDNHRYGAQLMDLMEQPNPSLFDIRYAVVKAWSFDEPQTNPPRRSAPVVFPDNDWCNPDDLWGIGFPTPDEVGACDIQENPRASIAPREAVAVLDAFGIKLATNPKTILCWNTLQKYTCKPTRWCKEHCYGWSINFQNSNAYPIEESNSFFSIGHTPVTPADIDEIALAIKRICDNNGLDNMRWHGIGDLTPGVEIDLIDALTVAGDFRVWGFTRRGDILRQYVPVRDNIVFQCSVDRSMPASRIEEQIRAAEHHGTSLALATEMGIAYKGRVYGGVSLPPWEHAEPIARPKKHWAPGPDPLIAQLPLAVVFGYHASRRHTRASVDRYNRPLPNPSECPATDPLGGGHFDDACLVCGWCMQKVAERPYATLAENRRRYVDTEYGRILLDTGDRR